jgi:hypothetical protein
MPSLANEGPVTLICVDPKRAHEIWPLVEALLTRAIARAGVASSAGLAHDVLHGGGLIWIAWSGKIEAAASTALQRTDAGLVCVVTACGGRHRQRWLPLLAGIEAYARQEGCAQVRIIGRRGWQRVLRGYDIKAVILDKELH